jgi:hypothetical protein
MSTGEYGLIEWIVDGIAAGNLLGRIQWKAYGANGMLSVKVIYRMHPNQKWFDRMKFEDVTPQELNIARMRMIEADRRWHERNLALQGELARIPGGVL